MRIMEIIRKSEGGMKEHAIVLVKGLLQKGHQVTVLCDFPEEDLLFLENAGAQVILFRFPGTIRPLKDLMKVGRLYSILCGTKPDVVHCHGFKAGLIGRMAGGLAGRPLVYTVHNFVLHGRTESSGFLIRSFEKWIYGKTDAVICVSQALKDSMTVEMGLSPRKIHVIHNSRPEWDTGDREKIRRQYGIGKDNVLIGTAARLIPSKGIHLFLKAAPAILDRYPDAILMIAGSGPEENRLKDMAQGLDIAGRVIFAGQISNMRDYYSAFDLFLLPTLSEGLGITILEAMSFGLPVIASAVGGIPELISHGVNGILIQPGSPSEIRDALVFCMENPQVAKAYGQQARADVRCGYSPEEMTAKTISVLESVLVPLAPLSGDGYNGNSLKKGRQKFK